MDSSTAGPSCLDACCRPWRPYEDFDGEEKLAPEEVYELLTYNKAGIETLNILTLMILILWALASLVPGFALFDGAASEPSAISHIGWWLPIQIFVLFFASKVATFNLSRKLERDIREAYNYATFVIALLVLGAIACIAHLVLAIIESGNCTSTLCTTHFGFLVALIVVLPLLTVILAWQAYRVGTWRNNMQYAFALAGVKGSVLPTGKRIGYRQRK